MPPELVPLTPAPSPAAAGQHPGPQPTLPRVLLHTVVLMFIGWLINRGIDPFHSLLIAGGGVAVGSSLLVLPRGLAKAIQAMGHTS